MESYSITNDFGGVIPKVGQLHLEITNETNITPILESVTRTEDTVEITFNVSLSPSEKTILDDIVSNHVPKFQPDTTGHVDILVEKNHKKTSYIRVATTILPPVVYAKAKSISWVDDNSSSYSVLIYDKTHKKIMLETTLNNTVESVQDLGELTNLSSEASLIEISTRRNGSSAKVYMESISINYS